MKQDISMFIDITEEPNDYLMVNYHEGIEPSITIHGISLPVTIKLTPDQAFNLMVELKSVLKNVMLALKERG